MDSRKSVHQGVRVQSPVSAGAGCIPAISRGGRTVGMALNILLTRILLRIGACLVLIVDVGLPKRNTGLLQHLLQLGKRAFHGLTYQGMWRAEYRMRNIVIQTDCDSEWPEF